MSESDRKECGRELGAAQAGTGSGERGGRGGQACGTLRVTLNEPPCPPGPRCPGQSPRRLTLLAGVEVEGVGVTLRLGSPLVAHTDVQKEASNILIPLFICLRILSKKDLL